MEIVTLLHCNDCVRYKATFESISRAVLEQEMARCMILSVGSYESFRIVAQVLTRQALSCITHLYSFATPLASAVNARTIQHSHIHLSLTLFDKAYVELKVFAKTRIGIMIAPIRVLAAKDYAREDDGK